MISFKINITQTNSSSENHVQSYYTFIATSDFQGNFIINSNKSESSLFIDSNFSGEIGLSYSDSKYNFLNYLKNRTLISRRIFYQSEDDLKKLTINFGEYPKSKFCYQDDLECQEENEYTSCKVENGWICKLNEISFGKNLSNYIFLEKSAILDISSDTIKFPSSIRFIFEDLFLNESKGDCYFDEIQSTYNCQNIDYVSDLNFVLNNTAYSIPAKDLFVFDETTHSYYSLIAFKEFTEISLGQAFLKKFTVIFDQENKLVSFLGGKRIRNVYLLTNRATNIEEFIYSESDVYLFILCVSIATIILYFIFYILFIKKHKVTHGKSQKQEIVIS